MTFKNGLTMTAKPKAKRPATITKAITSVLMRYQILAIELAFDAFSQGHIAITMDFVHDELWKERRDMLTQMQIKDMEKFFA